MIQEWEIGSGRTLEIDDDLQSTAAGMTLRRPGSPRWFPGQQRLGQEETAATWLHRGLAERDEENAATKKHARPKARDQIRRGKKNCGKYSWVHNFGFYQVNFAKHLEMAFFSPCHIVLGVGKLQQMANKNCQTVGVALRQLSLSISNKAKLWPLGNDNTHAYCFMVLWIPRSK